MFPHPALFLIAIPSLAFIFISLKVMMSICLVERFYPDKINYIHSIYLNNEHLYSSPTEKEVLGICRTLSLYLSTKDLIRIETLEL